MFRFRHLSNKNLTIYFYKNFKLNYITFEPSIQHLFPYNAMAQNRNLINIGFSISNHHYEQDQFKNMFKNQQIIIEKNYNMKIDRNSLNHIRGIPCESQNNNLLKSLNNNKKNEGIMNRHKKALQKNSLFIIMQKNFVFNLNFSNFYYIEEIPKTLKDLEIYQKKNTMNVDWIINNSSEILGITYNFNYELYSLAIFMNKFSENSEKKRKNINTDLLNILRDDNYAILNNIKNENSLNVEKYLKLIENLYMLKLNEQDKEAIQNIYLYLREKCSINIENSKRIFNSIYFYELSGNTLPKIKRDLFRDLKKNYLTLNSDDLYFYNSCLVFHSKKEISSFIDMLYQRIDDILDINNKRKLNFGFSLEQKLFNYLPLPKLFSEARYLNLNNECKENHINDHFITHSNSNIIDMYGNSLIKIEKFLTDLAKQDINIELLIPILSNTVNYLELKSNIFDLYIDKIYNNLAALTNDNLVELFFSILIISRNDEQISSNKKKLILEIFNILVKIKSEPRVYLDLNKFYIYLNVARNNLNDAFKKFCKNQNNEINCKNNNVINSKNFEAFKKLVKTSIDLFPFSVKDKEYSQSLLNEIFITFCKIMN